MPSTRCCAATLHLDRVEAGVAADIQHRSAGQISRNGMSEGAPLVGRIVIQEVVRGGLTRHLGSCCGTSLPELRRAGGSFRSPSIMDGCLSSSRSAQAPSARWQWLCSLLVNTNAQSAARLYSVRKRTQGELTGRTMVPRAIGAKRCSATVACFSRSRATVADRIRRCE